MKQEEFNQTTRSVKAWDNSGDTLFNCGRMGHYFSHSTPERPHDAINHLQIIFIQVLQHLFNPLKLCVTAVQVAYAKNLNDQCEGDLTFVQANVFRYRPDRLHDIVWSAGLFDYLDDKQLVFLLRRLYETVKPGGELVVGNFGPDNPSRNYMEFGQWFLNHRSTDQLVALGRQCGARVGQIRVDAESAGVNLFLRIEKR